MSKLEDLHRALQASLISSPSTPAVGQSVLFTFASKRSPTLWQWDFGDGLSSATKNLSLAYLAAGPTAATPTVSAGADSNSTAWPIAVGQPGIITVASPSLADVTAAIAAAGSGNTVIVPAGSAI